MIDKLREALAFYGNMHNWQDGGFTRTSRNTRTLIMSTAMKDRGERARAALAATPAPKCETCPDCAGSGFGGHPDRWSLCHQCGGSGGVKPQPAPDLLTGYRAALDEIDRLREALQDIAKQKKTDELVTVCDVEYADFEDGYDMCIDTARAALHQTEDET